ncbi:hypothetical protein Pcac1_g11884 [Phytophthora cactorum]|nr:hypothetical protein Pcac1_g11884 [Phytophthora cactorum]
MVTAFDAEIPSFEHLASGAFLTWPGALALASE